MLAFFFGPNFACDIVKYSIGDLGGLMAVTHYSVYRSEHYKKVKQAIDSATERNAKNVSKRYYTNKPEQSENKTFPHYLIEELINEFGSNYYYRTEVVENSNPIKSELHRRLEEDQNDSKLSSFSQLFMINVNYIKGSYLARFNSFESVDELFKYLITFPSVSYIFEYDLYVKKDALLQLSTLMELT